MANVDARITEKNGAGGISSQVGKGKKGADERHASDEARLSPSPGNRGREEGLDECHASDEAQLFPSPVKPGKGEEGRSRMPHQRRSTDFPFPRETGEGARRADGGESEACVGRAKNVARAALLRTTKTGPHPPSALSGVRRLDGKNGARSFWPQCGCQRVSSGGESLARISPIRPSGTFPAARGKGCTPHRSRSMRFALLTASYDSARATLRHGPSDKTAFGLLHSFCRDASAGRSRCSPWHRCATRRP